MRATDVNKLQEAKKTGVPILGMMLMTCNPDLAEMLGYAGIEYVFIDNEHNTASWDTLAHVMRACELSGIFPMIRVKKEYPGYPSNIRMAFEIGAGMVLVPHINTKEEAIAAVRAAKFGPEFAYGPWPADQIRGAMSDIHAAKYVTIQPPQYPTTFHQMEDEKRMLAIMLEEPKAFENLEEILSVKGIDDVHLGVGDLSVALGYPGQGGKAPGAKELLDKYQNLKKKHPEKFINTREIHWLDVLLDYEKAKSKIKQGLKDGAYLFNLPSERDIVRTVVQRCKKALDEAYEEFKNEK